VDAPPLRSKEEAQDYRYFPEPDLVPLEPDRELVDRLREELPESPATRIRRLEGEIGFSLAEGLVTSGRDELYSRISGERAAVANVVMNELAATGVDPASVNADELAKVIERRSEIPRAAFTDALAASGSPDFSAERYLAEAAIVDASELDPVIDRILSENSSQVEAFRGGKEGLLGFFVGQVMKETGGKANPKVVSDRLREKLKT
jgi:aspartyl-tRNA(Asn)/glutamyl-tRNA(Gln) amidotransferase subunit B